jgi:hypothetical protein
MRRQLKRENELIERVAFVIRFMGCGPDVTGDLAIEDVRDAFCAASDKPLRPADVWDERIEYGFWKDENGGDLSEGWSVSCGSYGEGHVFSPEAYGAIEVARVIVECEREQIRRWAGVLP